MNVGIVAGKDPLPAEKSAHDGKSDVKKGNCKHQQRCCHTEECRGFLTPDSAVARKQESEGQTATVAEEYARGLKLLRRKPSNAPASGTIASAMG